MKVKETKKVEVKTEEKKEFDMKECFVLWKSKAKSGLDYLTGKTPEGIKLVAYYNSNKKNPNEPDVRVYALNEDGKIEEKPAASVWENIGKNEKRYLSGTTNENEKIVGWYSKVEDEKKPYIRVYYKENTNDSELPF